MGRQSGVSTITILYDFSARICIGKLDYLVVEERSPQRGSP